VNRGSLEWRKGVAVVFEARGVRGKGKGGKWEGHKLKKLMGKLRRSEGREEAPAFATAAARWRSGGAAGGVSCVRKARGEWSRAGRGRRRRVERPIAGGGAGDGLERW
jgi:hypothetical protein